MLNLTKHEKLILIFLAASGLIGAAIIGYKNINTRIKLEVKPLEMQENLNVEQLVKESKIVNINTANIKEMSKLIGIGPVLAERIVKYRSEKGPFRNVEEINKVEGIGPKKFERLKEFIKVE